VPNWPSENEATIGGTVATNCMKKQQVVISVCLGIFTDFGQSEHAANFLLQKEFRHSIAAGDSFVLTGPHTGEGRNRSQHVPEDKSK